MHRKRTASRFRTESFIRDGDSVKNLNIDVLNSRNVFVHESGLIYLHDHAYMLQSRSFDLESNPSLMVNARSITNHLSSQEQVPLPDGYVISVLDGAITISKDGQKLGEIRPSSA